MFHWLIKGLGPGVAEQLLVSSARVADHARFHYEVAFDQPDKTQLVPVLQEAEVRAHRLTAGGSSQVWPVLLSTEHNMWSRFERPTRWLNGLTAHLDARRWAVSEEVVRSMWPSRAKAAKVLIHGIVQGANPPSEGACERVRTELGISDDAIVCSLSPICAGRRTIRICWLREVRVRENPGLVMLAAGQRPLMDEMTALHKELEVGDRFRFLDYRSDISNLLAADDIFTLSSEHKGLRVSTMEAMDVRKIPNPWYAGSVAVSTA